MKNQKVEITQKILTTSEQNINLEQALVAWWQNFRRDGGYRLTAEGFSVFQNSFDSYRIEIDRKQKITPKILLHLDKKIDYPYYIEKNRRSIVLFGSKEAMMVTLYGDIVTYLDNLEK